MLDLYVLENPYKGPRSVARSRVSRGSPQPSPKKKSLAHRRSAESSSRPSKTRSKTMFRDKLGRVHRADGKFAKKGAASKPTKHKSHKSQSRSSYKVARPRPSSSRRSHTSSRRPSSSSRRPKVRYITRRISGKGVSGKIRVVRRNPAYTLKDGLIALGVTAFGITSAMVTPWALAKKWPKLNQGWNGVLVAGGTTLVSAGLGYGILRLLGYRRAALMVAVEVGVGGVLGTGVKAVKVVMDKRSAPPAPKPTAPPAGGIPGVPGAAGFITPQQAQAARQLALQGFITPQQVAAAVGASEFGPEVNF